MGEITLEIGAMKRIADAEHDKLGLKTRDWCGECRLARKKCLVVGHPTLERFTAITGEELWKALCYKAKNPRKRQSRKKKGLKGQLNMFGSADTKPDPNP